MIAIAIIVSALVALLAGIQIGIHITKRGELKRLRAFRKYCEYLQTDSLEAAWYKQGYIDGGLHLSLGETVNTTSIAYLSMAAE